MMTQNPILHELKKLKPSLPNIKRLRVFGSVVTGYATPSSDLDLLIDFKETPSLFDLSELQNHLEEKLGVRVDIALENGLFPEIKSRILAEAVDV